VLAELDKRKGKATPALRAEGKRLRNLTREWLQTQPRDARFVLADESEAGRRRDWRRVFLRHRGPIGASQRAP
jgi:hypothetical protein